MEDAQTGQKLLNSRELENRATEAENRTIEAENRTTRPAELLRAQGIDPNQV